MAWQSTWLAVPLLIAAYVLFVLTLSMLLLARRKRMSASVGSILLFCLAGATWALAAAYRISNVGAGKHVWYAIGTGAIVIVVFAWFTFALATTNRHKWVQIERMGPLLGTAVFLGGLLATNPLHQWFWTAQSQNQDGLWVLSVQPTPAYIATLAGLALIGTASAVLLIEYAHAHDRSRQRTTALILGTIALPALTFVGALLNIGPPIDLTPVALVLPSATLVYVAFSQGWIRQVSPARATVIEQMDEGLIVVGERGQITDVNHATKHLLGIDERVLGKPIDDVLPEWPALDSGSTTVDLRRDETTARQLRLRVYTLEGQRESQIGLLSDRSDQESLHRRYQAIIEESAEVHLLIEADGTITYASPSVESILGWTPEELEGTSALDLIHVEDREWVRTEFQRVLAEEGHEPRLEYTLVDADGERRVFESLVRNLLEYPHVEAIVVTSRDVTDRTERERKLKAANQRLETFASILSHDLRNPLEIAEIHTTLAQRGDDDALETVEQAHGRIEDMIEDILLLLREDGGVNPEPLPIRPIVEQAWEAVPTGDVELEIAVEGDIIADRTALARALGNLFRNAVEHGEETTTVTVGAKEDRLFVADDGQGIPDQHRGQVFENGFTTAESGTGLGLSIVEQMAEAQGWDLSATDSATGGARFEFTGVEWDRE